MTSTESAEPMPCDDSSTERKKCLYGEHGFKPFQACGDKPGQPHCLTCGHAWGECNWHWVEEDPPPTPEEEEEAESCAHVGSHEIGVGGAPGGRWSQFHCDACGATWTRKWDTETAAEEAAAEEAAPKPPQPVRRPPYAVAYSIGGHAYEIALPGDAMIRAVDGALIITHSLGPVAGIIQAKPMEETG